MIKVVHLFICLFFKIITFFIFFGVLIYLFIGWYLNEMVWMLVSIFIDYFSILFILSF